MMIDFLEQRRFLSVSLVDGHLNIVGTSKADIISTRIVGGKVVASFNGKIAKFSGVTSIAINGMAGHDFLTHGARSIPCTILGGKGNDILCGGMGNDSLDGGSGNDRIYGQAGSDQLDGGIGNDSISGGTGIDSATYSTRTHGVVVELSSGEGGENGEYDELAGIEVVEGGQGNDWISGDDQDNTLHGGAGNDSLYGNGGQDELNGDAGDDDFGAYDEEEDALFGGDGEDEAEFDVEIDILDSIENQQV